MKSKSKWASLLVIVAKKEQRSTACVDYRKLNKITKFGAYPIPRVKEILNKTGNADFITTLDFIKGYWQVPMHPEDREKIAFQ